MKLLFVIIIVSSSFLCTAQESQNVQIFYIKNSGKYLSTNQRDSADYMRVVGAPDSAGGLYNISEYYIGEQKKLVGTSTTLDPPTFEGQCITYYKNGKHQRNERYKKGLLVGTQFEFFPNGRPYMVKKYQENNIAINNDIYTITENYDSLGTARVKNGNGYFISYYNNFKSIDEEGKVTNGRRDSIWRGSTSVIKGSFVEIYQNGLLTNGTASFTDGTTAQYKERQTAPQFKGGLTKFGNYLSNHINYPDYERKNNIQGRVIVSFIVEKDGHVTEVKVSRSVSPGLDNEAVKVIAKSPTWVPGIYFGKAARVAYSVPIGFSLSN